MSMHMPVGTHLLIECYGCKGPELELAQLYELAEDTGSKAVKGAVHQFKPQGASGFLIIEESHISFHSYPEFMYVAVDIFTCGDKTDPYKALPRLKELLKPQYVQINDVARGVAQ